MALTWSAASKNAANDARCARLNNGYLRIYTTGFSTLLAELRYGATAFGASALGVATANAMTAEDSCLANGTAATFRSYQSDGATEEVSGTVTATGGGGDLTLSSTACATGISITPTSHTITQP
jgi:hypothetical protein